jgi:hypothetical protein
MSLRKTMQLLKTKYCELQELLQDFRVTVQEDRPREGEAVVVDGLSDAADDILGWLNESTAELEQGIRVLDSKRDYSGAAKSLVASHQKLLLILHTFSWEMVRHERIDELVQLAKERDGEWPSWSASVRESLEQLRQPLNDVQEAMLECWQEVAESVSRKPIQSASA